MTRLRDAATVLRTLRFWLCLVLPCAGLLAPAPAYAFLEKRVESSTTTLELGSDGDAIVRHELRLEVHGAPLTSFTLRGVDVDAQPLPDATLLRLSGSQAASMPQPVEVHAASGVLEVSVPQRQGMRGTSFLLKVAYRTRLEARGLLRHAPERQRSTLSWVGPRFDDGVDAVTLIVRAPAGASAPEVDVAEAAGESYGALMSTLRRERDRDELELVRTHVARDEAMPWNVSFDRGLFEETSAPQPALDGAEAEAEEQAGATAPAEPTLPAPAERAPRGPSTNELLALGGAGLLYALLVSLKARSVALGASLRHCTPRAWIAWPSALRALTAGAALAAAGAIACFGDSPLAAALALLVAMAFAAHHPPAREPTLQGPGEWKPLGDAALARSATPAVPGAWLDAGRARGFVTLLAALGGVSVGAARAFEFSPYSGACILLAGSALLPVFCTGRAGELPLDALSHSRRFLGQVVKKLSRDATVVVTPIGRVAAANGELDELRLSISPTRAVPGLRGMELGIELRPRIGGYSARPVFIVRAAEGSECQRMLPRGLTWTRGRNADERATLVRPKLPTVTLTVALANELLELMLSTAKTARSADERRSSDDARPAADAAIETQRSPTHSARDARDAAGAPSPLAV